jgi:hypothetical protein
MMSAKSPSITLNSGVELPALGLGVFQSPPAETASAVEAASRAATGSPIPPLRTSTSARLFILYLLVVSTACATARPG